MRTYASEQIRNVVLVSHTGSGKSSLAEALLFTSGASTRLGRVEDGNTITDFEPEEMKRRSSVQLSVVPCEWEGHKINVLSTPGYLEFVGEVMAALSVADGAILLVDAAVGVEVGTELRWRDLEEKQLPRFIFINKMDREGADFIRAVDSLQKHFGRKCVPIQVPVGSQANFQGVINLVDAGAEIPPALADPVRRFQEQLMEAAAEADEELTEKYLYKGELSPEDVVRGLKKGVKERTIIPVLAGSALQNKGSRELLQAVGRFLPSPLERPPVEATLATNKGKEPLSPKAGGPLGALVFKTTADPFVGRLSYLRVFSGTVNSDSQVFNASTGQMERIGQLYVPRGKTQEPVPNLPAGDIGTVAKLANTYTGDTLATKEKPYLLPRPKAPDPVYSVAVYPKSKADMDKMAMALNRMCEEDPSLRLHRDQDTGETILSGLGDSHMEVTVERVKRKFGVDLIVQMPKVPYREAITAKTVAEYKHKKQTGGHGQYGHVFLELEPIPGSADIEFGTRVVGGSVPREYFAAVEKGVMEAVQEGVVAGFRVVGARATLIDGSYHPVDSSNISFQIAAAHATRKGIQQANPVILEPIYHVKVTVPDGATGDVVGDLNSKRGRVLGMYPEDGFTTIEAEVPLAEVQRYATTLRSMTQGRGVYTMAFDHYEVVPPHLQQRLVEQRKQQQQQG